MKPAEILINDYTYVLPAGKIAQFPLKERDSSRLLVYRNGNISEHFFSELPKQVKDGSLLIFNNTRVINARLKFQSPAGKDIEIFMLEPAGNAELSGALQLTGSAEWLCLVGNLKHWKHGVLEAKRRAGENDYSLSAELVSRREDAFIVKLSWQPADLTMAEVLEIFGNVPLPPYMKRETVIDDSLRYQTVYSEVEGSVAAPTAGLHFTDDVLEKLKNSGINEAFVTLHVGAGTFKPVKSESIEDHLMHSESFSVPKDTIEQIHSALGKSEIIAIGTTSMRTVESLYWFGVQLIHGNHSGNEVLIGQWEPYLAESSKTSSQIEAVEAIRAVLDHMSSTGLKELHGRTNIIMVPGYEFKIFSGLVTNFHQPASTLLLLVAAFIGSDWQKVYEYALKNDFRFLSYGDSSLLFRSLEY
ncbi:MAG: S-adenosylmethionine:tRNA ribosyltransferase-isomerase [Ignavibacteria bacterium]|nr:S-adenosylmethionine:tRNA ribosyltransferase-isomerase [Ignavibacteria bacterium]